MGGAPPGQLDLGPVQVDATPLGARRQRSDDLGRVGHARCGDGTDRPDVVPLPRDAGGSTGLVHGDQRAGLGPDGVDHRRAVGAERVGIEAGEAGQRALACSCLARLDAEAFGADRTPMIEANQFPARRAGGRAPCGGAAGVAWPWDDVRSSDPRRSEAGPGGGPRGRPDAGRRAGRIDVHGSQAELAVVRGARAPTAYEAPSMVRPGTDGVVPPPLGVTYRALASQGFG